MFSGTTNSFIKREAQTMEIAMHENVVKFLGLEQHEKELVLVMELCEDGNLQQMISERRNGLSGTEFPRLCDQLVRAMEHLHLMKITHRDLKPGNILVSRFPDGIVYKIGDFGAARILQAGETFDSMYGTYEYFHPAQFHKFFYKLLNVDNPPQTFDETYDFWALGATLYEAATGHLPFMPENGRDDPKKMFEMLTKGDGIISAKERNNEIHYERQLPAHNPNKSITPFLAKLLNVSNLIFKAFVYPINQLDIQLDIFAYH